MRPICFLSYFPPPPKKTLVKNLRTMDTSCYIEGMAKLHIAAITALISGLQLTGCGQDEKGKEPRTAQEMYEHVQELIKPNVQHEASDPTEALKWLRRAAEAGHLQAQTDLGGIYFSGGTGVHQDGKESLKWFTLAANQGSKEALVYMGLIHRMGLGVPHDEMKAREYWKQAAEAGIAEAQYYMGSFTTATGDLNAAKQAEWLRRAVQSGNPGLAAKAACALGYLYAEGKGGGIRRDMKESARWYAIAAQGGDMRAQLVYGIMLLQGESVPKDAEKGMSYIRMSAGQDNPQAIALLINLLRNEKNAQENENEAAAWSERLEKLRIEKPTTSETH